MQSGQPALLKIGLSEAVNTALAIWMADAAGFYQAAGIRAEIASMNGGSRGAAALAAGEIDVMHVGLSSVVGLNRKGADLRVIAALANVIRFTFFAAPEVTTAADLKGATIGITSFGSESDTTTTFALRRLGLSRDEVVLKEYGGGARRLAALKAGEIAATALNEPVSSLAREEGLHVLLDLVPEKIPWLFTGIVVRRATLQDRHDVLTRFVKATAEGNTLALSDAGRAKAVLAEQANIRDAKILDIAYEDFRALSPPTLEPTKAGAENILAQFPDVGGTLGDYIDTGILDSLHKEGLFTTLERTG